MRNMDSTFTKASSEHYNNTMYLLKDERNEEELKRRHIKDQSLNTGLIEKKKQEIS